MEPSVTVKEVKILETAEDIQERREQVLKRYVEFKEAARVKREKLEDSRRYQYFRRDAEELESWIYEKLQVASDESFRDSTNLQAKIQKHQAFEAEVAANSNAIVQLDNKVNNPNYLCTYEIYNLIKQAVMTKWALMQGLGRKGP